MKTALTLLIEAFTAELDRRGYKAPGMRTGLKQIAEGDPEFRMTVFGEFVIGVTGYYEERTAHALDSIDMAHIFDAAEVASLDAFGHRTEQTEAIDSLWSMIEDRLPQPDFFGHEAEVTGYYGRARYERGADRE